MEVGEPRREKRKYGVNSNYEFTKTIREKVFFENVVKPKLVDLLKGVMDGEINVVKSKKEIVEKIESESYCDVCWEDYELEGAFPPYNLEIDGIEISPLDWREGRNKLIRNARYYIYFQAWELNWIWINTRSESVRKILKILRNKYATRRW